MRQDDNPYIIEINPLPGILPNPDDNSCFPKAAREVGIDYDGLIQQCVEYGDRKIRIESEMTNVKAQMPKNKSCYFVTLNLFQGLY